MLQQRSRFCLSRSVTVLSIVPVPDLGALIACHFALIFEPGQGPCDTRGSYPLALHLGANLVISLLLRAQSSEFYWP